MKLCKKSWNLQLKRKIVKKFLKAGKMSMNYINIDNLSLFFSNWISSLLFSKLNLFPSPGGGGRFWPKYIPLPLHCPAENFLISDFRSSSTVKNANYALHTMKLLYFPFQMKSNLTGSTIQSKFNCSNF